MRGPDRLGQFLGRGILEQIANRAGLQRAALAVELGQLRCQFAGFVDVIGHQATDTQRHVVQAAGRVIN